MNWIEKMLKKQITLETNAGERFRMTIGAATESGFILWRILNTQMHDENVIVILPFPITSWTKLGALEETIPLRDTIQKVVEWCERENDKAMGNAEASVEDEGIETQNRPTTSRPLPLRISDPD